jgi:SAM-dependent methyltransferase
MAALGPKPNERVIDIGCGCGATSLELARRVGPGGRVLGADISAPMLEVARRRANAEGLTQAGFVEADAQTYQFTPADAAFSRFGVMFFADPLGAFSNIRKALSKDRRLAFVCWREFPENVWAARPLAAALDLLPPQPSVDPHAPGPFAFADSARLVSILRDAGFRDPCAEKLDTVMNMGATVEDAAKAALSVGPLARAAGEVDDATKAKILERVSPVLSEFKTPAGITPPAACWLVGARA